MKEQDLYLPVKTLFESMEYEVHGEVHTVDVIAKSDHIVVAIELKKDFSLKLIAQGAKRHKLTDFSYIAIPKPSQKSMKSEAFKDKLYLLSRLGIGLILIDTKHAPFVASIYREPTLQDIKALQTRNKKKRAALLKEIRNRHCNYNIGGTRGKTLTSYRENALRILYCLRDGAPHPTKEVRELTGNRKSTTIMYNNHYGWFTNISKGYYQANANGLKALEEYKDIIKELVH